MKTTSEKRAVQASRANPEIARQLFEGFIPDPELRTQILHLWADTALYVARGSRGNWSVTLFDDGARFIVGQINVLIVNFAEVILTLDFERVDWAAIDRVDPEKEITVDYNELDWQRGYYPSTPHSSLFGILQQMYPATIEVVRPAYESLLRIAWMKGLNRASFDAYSPGILAYIEEALDKKLPRPGWTVRSPRPNETPRNSGDIAPRPGSIKVGNCVVVQEGGEKPETWVLVHADRAAGRTGEVSVESPVGKALFGHIAGETVEVATPGGLIMRKILEVK